MPGTGAIWGVPSVTMVGGTAEQWIKEEGKRALALDAAVLPCLPGQRGAL